MEPEFSDLGGQQRQMLEIIWQRDGATVQEVLDEINANSKSQPLAYTTVLATLQKLEKMGWLTHRRSKSHQRAYIYRATQTRSEAIGGSLRAFAENFLDGDKTLLFQHFVNDTGLTEKELAEIRAMIDKRRKHK